MRFFPWVTEEFTSPLPPAELLRWMQGALGSRTRQPLSGPTQPFWGSVAGNSFTIQRIIDYRNSMLPQITGWVEPGYTTGSRLRLRHRLHPITLAFGAFWLLAVSLLTIGTLGSLLLGDTAIGPQMLLKELEVPLIMLVFGLLLLTVPFWWEVSQSRPLLVELLQLTPAASS